MKSPIPCLIPLIFAILQQKVYHVASFQSSQHQRQHRRVIPASTFTVSRHVTSTRRNQNSIVALNMAEKQEDEGDEFWQQQRDLMNEMSDVNEQSLKEEQSLNYAKMQTGLIVETVFFSALVFSLLWLACDNPFVPFSYVFGASFGVAYTYGLTKYVEVIGGTIDDASAIKGAGVGQARFAFLILLFLFVGKLRVYGLQEIPSIMGFFTYQLATLSQGLKEEKMV